jgi:predicted NBD/HSP70 family sugar kinase
VPEKDEHHRTYLRVRIPNYVLLHGEQLRRNHASNDEGFNQTRMWELVDTNPKHVNRPIRELRQDCYLAQGRPLRLGPETGVVLGISLGRESLKAALIDANGAIRQSEQAAPVQARLRQQTPAQTLDDLCDLANRVLAAGIDTAIGAEQGQSSEETLLVERTVKGQSRRLLPLLGVAVAWPMPIHRYRKEFSGGKPTVASVHDGWWDKHLPTLVADRLGLEVGKVHAVNDANAAAIAAVFDQVRNQDVRRAKRDLGKGQPEYPPTRVAMTVRVGGGIGAGTMAVGAYDPKWFSSFNDAALIETETGLAGEIGHLVVDPHVVESVNLDRGELPPLDPKAKCACGAEGHLEGLASAASFVERLDQMGDEGLLSDLGLRTGELPPDASTMYDVISRIESGAPHRPAERALQDMGRLIGHALAGPVLMLGPSTITLAGSAACQRLAIGVKEGLIEGGGLFGTESIGVHYVRGSRNRFNAARGAALFVFRQLLYRKLDDFERLYARAGDRQLPPGERLFSQEMRLLDRSSLPLGAPRRSAGRRTSR